MSERNIKIEHQTDETHIDVRRIATDLGVAAVVGGSVMAAAKFGMGGEAAPAPELPQHTDKHISFVLEEGGTVEDGAFAQVNKINPNITETQGDQIVQSSREAARANGIPQPGDGFMLNIGEYDGKPGVDYKVTPQGVSPETEEK